MTHKLSPVQIKILSEMVILHDGHEELRNHYGGYEWLSRYDVGMKWPTKEALLRRGLIEERTKYPMLRREYRVTDAGREALSATRKPVRRTDTQAPGRYEVYNAQTGITVSEPVSADTAREIANRLSAVLQPVYAIRRVDAS
jgi:DNA-binding PadR family transcriptional regulator